MSKAPGRKATAKAPGRRATAKAARPAATASATARTSAARAATAKPRTARAAKQAPTRGSGRRAARKAPTPAPRAAATVGVGAATTDDAAIRARLAAFIVAMNGWERACAEQDEAIEDGRSRTSEEVASRQQAAALARIVDAHCTRKPRAFGRLGSYRQPPEYDPSETIRDVSVSGSRAVVITQATTGFAHQHRYLLVRVGGQWRLDRKEYWSGPSSAWKGTPL